MWYIMNMITTFDAVADPTRRQILDLLRVRPHTVNELVELLEISQPGVSKQLKVLREVGLVQVRQEAQKHWYELRPEPLAEVFNWVVNYRNLIEERYERLDELLKTMQEEEQNND
jgi:DNA-binding transcriptional ArsR family regulator